MFALVIMNIDIVGYSKAKIPAMRLMRYEWMRQYEVCTSR